MSLILEAEALRKAHFFDPESSVATMKERCMEGCCEILKENDVTWDEFRVDRSKHVTLIRQQVCAFTFLCLDDYMSQVCMAKFLGIGRPRFRDSYMRYFGKINGTTSKRKR